MTTDVEIICIGNELLIGKIENTNANWLVNQITALSANVKRITVIQDIVDEIANCIQEVGSRKPKFIITTGGLGPTFDDKTLQSLAKALNQKLVVNPEALEFVKQRTIQYYKKRGLPPEDDIMTPPRVKMAMLPEKTDFVINPIGTAPAVRAKIGESVLFTLPGVPMEMKAIFIDTIMPMIKQAVGSDIFCQLSIFADMGESCLAPLIETVMRDNGGIYVKSHPLNVEGKPQVELHLTITAYKEHQPAETLKKAAEQLGKLIVDCGGKVHF